MSKRICREDAVVRQNGVDAVGNRLEQVLEELLCGLSIRLIYELGDGKLARPVDA